ncbi:MAG: hypothetical protein ABEJ93_03065 [Candidatus Nanohalobium sp.]
MVTRRKGASTLVVVFIILTISLISITWFRANTSSGTGTQQDLVQQSQINTFNHRFKNAKLYLENSLFYAGQKGSYKAANYSGRKWKTPEARYWVCRGNNQIPSRKMARNATANFTSAMMKKRINEIHGLRNQLIYKAGKIKCAAAGYDKPLLEPGNDDFKMATEIESLQVSRRNGGLSRTEENITFLSNLRYNRYWYMYSTLRKWVKNEDLKDEIREQMKKVPDQKARSKTMCLESGSNCRYLPSYTCKEKTTRKLEARVKEGLEKEMQKLISNSAYFNNTHVTCSVLQNKIRIGQTKIEYPGFGVSKEVDKRPIPQPIPTKCKGGKTEEKCHEETVRTSCKRSTQDCYQSCYTTEGGDRKCTQYCYSDCKEWNTKTVTQCKTVCAKGTVKDPPPCGRDYKCQTSWYLKFKAYVDYTVTCRDRKFRAIPGETLRNQRWRIDLSYTVSEATPSGGTFNCNRRASSTGKAPTQLKSCSFQRTASLCKTPVDLTGKTTE